MEPTQQEATSAEKQDEEPQNQHNTDVAVAAADDHDKTNDDSSPPPPLSPDRNRSGSKDVDEEEEEEDNESKNGDPVEEEEDSKKHGDFVVATSSSSSSSNATDDSPNEDNEESPNHHPSPTRSTTDSNSNDDEAISSSSNNNDDPVEEEEELEVSSPAKQQHDDKKEASMNAVKSSSSIYKGDMMVKETMADDESCESSSASASASSSSSKAALLVENITPVIEEKDQPSTQEQEQPEPLMEMMFQHEAAKKKKKDLVEQDGDEESSTASCVSRWSLGCLQFGAIMSKNALTKVRTPLSTSMEILAPVLIMLVLVFAYRLSEISHHSGRTYSVLNFDAPGPWVNLASTLVEIVADTTANEKSPVETTVDTPTSPTSETPQRKLLRLFPDVPDDDSHDDHDVWLSQEQLMQAWSPDWLLDLVRKEQQELPGAAFNDASSRHLQDEASSNSNTTSPFAGSAIFDVDDMFDLLNDGLKIVRRVLVNPMTVPTLDQYLLLSTTLSTLVPTADLPQLWQDSQFLQDWGNLLTLGTLHLSPSDSPVTLAFEQYLNQTAAAAAVGVLKIQSHASQEAAVQSINDAAKSLVKEEQRTWALIDFSHFPQAASNDDDVGDDQDLNVKYTIRMNQTTLPDTDQIVNYVTTGLSRRYQRYYLSGYLTLQQTLNDFAFAYFNLTTSSSSNNATNTTTRTACDDLREQHDNVWSMPMPTAAYMQNQFFLQVGYLLGLTMVMAFLFPTSRLIKTLVEEKETRMRETLYILGVSPWAHFCANLGMALLVFGVTAVLVTAILASQVLKYSNALLLLAWIALFLTATTGFCFCIAAIFSKAKLASIVGPMAFFATILPRFIFFGSNRYEAATQKMWASLLPATAFAFGADIVADYEYSQQGVQDWNRSEGAYSFDTCLTMLLLDTFLYLFLAWYLDQVVPRQYGTAQPFWFLFSPYYWCGGCGVAGGGRGKNKAATSMTTTSEVVHSTDESSDSNSSRHHDDSDVEEPSSAASQHECMADPSLVAQIKIRNLTKQYTKQKMFHMCKKKKKDDDDMPPPAVNHLDLDLYESQITTLLGHNGAGKTTVISLLTGLFAPTSGDASIYGKSIVDKTAQARRSIGICPQQNVLFERLTVLEHIRFFTKIKGVRPFTLEQAKVHAQEIGLGEFLYTTSAALSGGNKRKLCVAVALCGDPKFLVLDEPTSGMDPCARRSTWEVLRKKRLGRTILLSTHFMDEAELLSDRIAVLRTGNLLCSGTPLFLKNRHGLGYNFTVVMESLSSSSSAFSSSPVDPGSYESSAEILLSFIRRYIPEADIGRIGGKEVTIRIPPGYEDVFPACFDELETQKDGMQIGAFGIQNASLEEVFIRLAEDDSDENDSSISHMRRVGNGNETTNPVSTFDQSADHDPESADLSTSNVEGDGQYENHYMSPLQQLLLLYQKRVTTQKRDPKGLCFAVVVPVILVALSLFVLTVNLLVAGPAIELTPSIYQVSNSGGAAMTDVLVAGGFSAGRNASDAAALIAPMYENLRGNVEEQYPHVQFDRVESNFSSDDVSEYLYNSINTHDHNMRYGAFVLDDAIVTKLSVDWPELMDDLDDLALGLYGALSDDNKPLVIQLPNSVVQEGFLAVTELLPDTLVNVSEITNLTGALLETMFADSDISKTDFRIQMRDSVTRLYNETGLKDFAGGASVNYLSIEPVLSWFGISELDLTSAGQYIVGQLRQVVSQLGGVDDVVPFLTEIANKLVPGSDPLTDLFAIATMELDDRLRQDDVADQVVTRDEILAMVYELPLFQNSSASDVVGTITLYPSESTVNIAFTLNAPAIVGEEPVSFNVSLADLRELAPMEKTTYRSDIPTDASILHNASSPHAVAAFNQAFTESIFKQCTGKRSARLISENHPLPLTTQQNIEIKTALSILAVMFVLIPFCYIPGAFVVFLVKEKSCKSKHLQLVSGVNLTSYWIASYLYDITLYLALTILVMVVFLLYGKDAAQVFVGDAESFLCTLTLTFGYGISVLPYSYLLARRFQNHSSAQIAVIGFIFLTGFIAVNAYFIMLSIEATEDVARSLRPLFRCWPPFLVGEGLIMMALSFWERGILGSDSRPFNWDVAGKPIVLLYSLAIPYFVLLLALEYSQDGGAGGILGRILRSVRDSWERLLLRIHGVKKVNGTLTLDDGLVDDKDALDDDVLEEERRVNENCEAFKHSAPIMYHNLWKVYPPSVGLIGSMMASLRQCLGRICCCFLRRCRNGPSPADLEEKRRAFMPKRAVRGVSTVVEEGETYALLGANGAGKTSTLGVLTGDVSATSGQVYVAGHDATGIEERDGVTRARRQIGFCPQVDPLLDLMTSRETLRMYGSLRGIPSGRIDGKVEGLLEQLSLTPHADKPSQSLSGGNKRKLSLGIALIGDPKVLLIDESSSGMDPLAKRRMWNLIAEVSKNRTVIATTHSMEEAEALCTRAGIMAKGQLLCLGSVQHLKTKYLDGYTIDVFCLSGRTEEEIDSVVKEMIEKALPGCRLSERYGRFLRFDVPSLSSLGLGTTFRHMQALKTSPFLCVENYSISQCSLEQVFVKLVEKVTTEAAGGTDAVVEAD